MILRVLLLLALLCCEPEVTSGSLPCYSCFAVEGLQNVTRNLTNTTSNISGAVYEQKNTVFTIPEFDTSNKPTVGKQYPPCSFHSKVTCRGSRAKCVISVEADPKGALLDVRKGCSNSSLDSGCQNYTSGDITGQECVCNSRLCNADLIALGGYYVPGLYPSPGVIVSMNNFLIIGLVGVTLLFGFFDFSGSLTCCKAPLEQDEGQEMMPGKAACVNAATGCHNVGCDWGSCENPAHATCDSVETCNSTNSFCYIRYLEKARKVRAEMGAEQLAIVLSIKIEQGCTADDEGATEGCEFFRKIYYTDINRRTTTEKECYCKSSRCNHNLSYACMAVDDDITTVDETCSRSAIFRQLNCHALIICLSLPILIKNVM